MKYKKGHHVKVPKIYWDFTRRAVLTMEWVDGIKLTDGIRLNEACLNRRELIDQVVGRNHTTYMCTGIFSYLLFWLCGTEVHYHFSGSNTGYMVFLSLLFSFSFISLRRDCIVL